MAQTAPSETLYSIRDLAESFGVTPRALRFYEQQGLLSPELRGKRVGFALSDIKEMLDLEATEPLGLAHMTATLSRFRERICDLERQREDIDAAISELEAGCAWLEDRMARREPPEDVKRRARAFEALAQARLSQWHGAPPD
jgi:DNA-binding transcriptional MerR regulator